jgi:type II secretory ATPase GspE/PulE/Tfp pilus assembly ATPase PilB-like protein
MVIAQRLVRKICTNCCTHTAPTEQQITAFRQHGIAPPQQLVVPVGCDSCYQAGYRGRTGIYEVIRMDREIQSLIFTDALQSDIEEAAVKAGTSLMLHQALKKAAAGITSFEEVYRVVADA